MSTSPLGGGDRKGTLNDWLWLGLCEGNNFLFAVLLLISLAWANFLAFLLNAWVDKKSFWEFCEKRSSKSKGVDGRLGTLDTLKGCLEKILK